MVEIISELGGTNGPSVRTKNDPLRGQYSWTTSVAVDDDGVLVLVPPETNGIAIIGTGEGLVARTAAVLYQVDASPVLVPAFTDALPTGSVVVLSTSAALTGTTGTDAKLNVAAYSDGKLYIENRLGASKTITVTFMR
jgi:hypothetical protein